MVVDLNTRLPKYCFWFLSTTSECYKSQRAKRCPARGEKDLIARRRRREESRVVYSEYAEASPSRPNNFGRAKLHAGALKNLEVGGAGEDNISSERGENSVPTSKLAVCPSRWRRMCPRVSHFVISWATVHVGLADTCGGGGLRRRQSVGRGEKRTRRSASRPALRTPSASPSGSPLSVPMARLAGLI
jgi:hypothetical protein